MSYLGDSAAVALRLLASLDPDVWDAVRTSVGVSVVSIVLATILAVPVGTGIGLADFPLKRLTVTVVNTLTALPTVVVGLLVYGLLSRQGPLGELGLLFTPQGMIIGQTVLAVPIVAHYAMNTVTAANPAIMETAMTLGAGRVQAAWQLLREVRFGIMAAVIAGFGRVIAEVGVAMMLGGNIKGYTRTMTTAIALETSKGEFAFGLALGIILMTVALVVNLLLNFFQQRQP